MSVEWDFIVSTVSLLLAAIKIAGSILWVEFGSPCTESNVKVNV